jgi:hypothetical protein
MAKTILVILNPENNVQLLLRRLESVVRPGNQIVFLLRSQLDMSMWLLAQVASLQTGFDNGLAWQEQRMRVSWEEQKSRAEKDIAEPVRRAFSRIGVQVEVVLYRHSLTSIVKWYLKKSEIALILVATSSWLQRLKIVPIRVRNWLVRRLPHRPCFSLIPPRAKIKWFQWLTLPNLGR